MQVRPRSLRQFARYNRSLVLDLIRRFGPVSRAELAERSGLAPSSLTNISSWLSDRNFIRYAGRGPSSGGRPPTLLELNPGAGYAVGAAVRRCSVDAVLLDFMGDVAAEASLPLESREPGGVLDSVVAAIDAVGCRAPGGWERVLGVGVSMPGPVSGGHALCPFDDDAWRNFPLAGLINQRIGQPVSLANHAHAGALAEYRIRGGFSGSLVYVCAGDHLGAGIVLDGVLYRGVDGLAGDIGQMLVDVHGRMQTPASVRSVVRQAAQAGQSSPASSTLSAVAVGGDPGVGVALQEAVAYLATAVTTYIWQLRPEVVVLGGEMFDGRPAMVDLLRREIDHGPTPDAGTCVTGSVLGRRAASIGAATIVLDGFFEMIDRYHLPADMRAQTGNGEGARAVEAAAAN